MNPLADLSPAVLAGVAALVLVQLALQIVALVSLARTPSERLALGGRKWVWALVIILGEIIGPIVYFAAGRLPEQAEDLSVTGSAGAMPASQRATRAADTLYGAAPAVETRAAADADAPDAALDPAAGADGTGMGELP